MDCELGFACIVALLAGWIAYRMRGYGPEVLPPPDKACERNSVEAVF